MKKGFVLYQDQYEPIKALSQEQKGDLLDALFQYQRDGTGPEQGTMVSMAFSFFKIAFDRDSDKYLKRCEKNKENIRKRWNTKDTNEYDRIPNVPIEVVRETEILDTDRGTKEQEPLCDPSHDEPFYMTAKKKKLTGKRLEAFEEFWSAFDYKKGKAPAADAWLAIPELTNNLVSQILVSSKLESQNRQNLIDNGKTPKMAQGWLTERRWEDEAQNSNKPKMSFSQAAQGERCKEIG